MKRNPVRRAHSMNCNTELPQFPCGLLFICRASSSEAGYAVQWKPEGNLSRNSTSFVQIHHNITTSTTLLSFQRTSVVVTCITRSRFEAPKYAIRLSFGTTNPVILTPRGAPVNVGVGLPTSGTSAPRPPPIPLPLTVVVLQAQYSEHLLEHEKVLTPNVPPSHVPLQSDKSLHGSVAAKHPHPGHASHILKT
jgi:hypothetical protein